jgi:UDP-N-acetylglucosamine 4,6-dehydratase
MDNEIVGKVFLISGGTGSLGKHLVKRLLKKRVKKIIVYSRGEFKQVEMEREVEDKRVRFLIGDIRDRDRLKRAFKGVEIALHCAALKHVPKGERDPLEFKKTNVDGAENIIEAAIDCQVERVLAISTDKAVNPSNTYGRTKALADDLFIRANVYGDTKFSVIRFGNFLNSSGSVVPLFQELKRNGADYLPITSREATRFFISLDSAVNRIFDALKIMNGGEVFSPIMPSMKIEDIAKAIHPEAKLKDIGMRKGEKINEDLIIPEDAPNTREYKKFFITNFNKGKKVPENFIYRSDLNWEWMAPTQIGGIE